MTTEKMERVTRDRPCPICGHSDWCLVSPDGSAAICPRTKEGSLRKCGDAGYLHLLKDGHNGHDGHRNGAKWRHTLTIAPGQDGRTPDFGQLSADYQSQLTSERLQALAGSLGLSAGSLQQLRVGWDGAAFTFPMSDAEGRVIGIRRRFENGFKCSVRGSKSGLFIPADLTDSRRLLITEGVTDAAVALDLEFNALGRPSCRGAIDMIAQAAKGRAEVVVVGDNDEVGKRGAMELADALVLHYRVKVVFPPVGVKDLRAWLLRGLVGEKLQLIIDSEPFVDVRVESEGARL